MGVQVEDYVEMETCWPTLCIEVYGLMRIMMRPFQASYKFKETSMRHFQSDRKNDVQLYYAEHLQDAFFW